MSITLKAKDNHGPYSFCSGAAGYLIRRLDNDGHRRTVAFVDSKAQWDRFVAALESGAGEVEAVHAIDKEKM